MKILFFLNNDIHAANCLNLLATSIKNHQIRIILSQKIGNTNNLPQQLIDLKNLEKGGIEKIVHQNFQLKFLRDKIFSYAQVNCEEALQDFKKFSPDLIISIRFGQILKLPLINIPRFGVLNLHSGILPNYRGVLASFWAILNGEKNLGTTLHYIRDNGIDTGDIIGFTKTKTDYNSSLVSNISNLYSKGCKLIGQTVAKISDNQQIVTINQKTLGFGQYFSYPKSEDVKNFLKIMPLFGDKNLQQNFLEMKTKQELIKIKQLFSL